MSYFGHGTQKQALLDAVEEIFNDEHHDALEALGEIVALLAERAKQLHK